MKVFPATMTIFPSHSPKRVRWFPAGIWRVLWPKPDDERGAPEQPPEFLGPATVVLRLDGVATTLAEGLAGEGFLQDPLGNWRPLVDDGLYAVEEQCVRLHDELAATIFGSGEHYWSLLPTAPAFLSEAGLNSEAAISRDQFEQLLIQFAKFPELHRFLYLYDCRMLVSAIQECTKEVCQLTSEFYRILNMEPFFTPSTALDDGTRWSTSANVTNLNATLGFLFIRMHSLLDYLTKLAREVESLRTDFATYPRLASSNILFGHKHRLGIANLTGTLFEACDEVAEVERVRNLVIHDGLLDDTPKAYEVIRGGKAIERFVLMPDVRDAQFERFKNRRLFYGGEDKINLRLTRLVRAFQARQVATLKAIRGVLTPSAPQ